MLTDDLIGFIALDMTGAGIPAFHKPFATQQEYRVIMHTGNDLAEMPFNFVQGCSAIV